jgi:hypothetical protein
MPTTQGATKALVELPILRCLATGGWKQPGEIKDFVARSGNLPIQAKKALSGRPAEAQSNNAVQNAISESRAGSLTKMRLIEYDSFKGAYKITLAGRARLAEIESGN